MNLRNDIAKVTNLPKSVKGQAKFKPLNGRGRAEQDLDMNNRPLRLKNGNNRGLYEEEREAVGLNNFRYDEKNFDDIRSSVREVNGGELSNELLEQHIRRRQTEASRRNKEKNFGESNFESSESSSPLSSDCLDSASASYKTVEDNDSGESSEEVKKTNNPYLKNGVIRGLLGIKIIDEKDLAIDETPKSLSNKQKNSVEDSEEDCSFRVNLVQDPDDPDFYTHPLQASDRPQLEDDFVLDRIGRKETTTAKVFQIRQGDSCLDFVNKK